jgi:hypothetical protein
MSIKRMREIVVLLCLSHALADTVDVKFQIITKQESPLQPDDIDRALASQGLVQPVAANLALVDLNATIISGQCTAGYYWESNKCLKCQCASFAASEITTMWFEPLI